LYELATHYPYFYPVTQYHGLSYGQRTDAFNALLGIEMYLPSTLA